MCLDISEVDLMIYGHTVLDTQKTNHDYTYTSALRLFLFGNYYLYGKLHIPTRFHERMAASATSGAITTTVAASLYYENTVAGS